MSNKNEPPARPAIKPPTKLKRRAFELLRDLEANNRRDWYAEHADAFKQLIFEPLTSVFHRVSAALADQGEDLSGGAHSLFRMQKDARFAPPDAPFRLWAQGVLSRGNRHRARGAIQVRLTKDGGSLSAGSFMMPPADLATLRSSMVARQDRFLRIADGLQCTCAPLASEKNLTRMPRGFHESPDEALGTYLRMKAPLAVRPLSKSVWLRDEAVDAIVSFAATTRAYRLFQLEALEGE